MSGPHDGARVLRTGPPAREARAAVLAVHGRGGSPESMIELAPVIGLDDVTWLAPAASGRTWYPESFLAPMERNEPALSSALALLAARMDGLQEEGLPPERVVLLGFSQGGCLALEFAARNARRYGGVVGWSAGLIGPPETPRDYEEGFEGAPVFLGCSDADPHVPLSRFRESAEVFRRLGAEVTDRIYPGMGHTVNEEEIAFLQRLLENLSPGPRPAPS